MGKPKDRQRRKDRTRDASDAVEPYSGNKYKTEEYVKHHLRAETGIYEAYVLSGRVLTDHQVAAALKRLVVLLRCGPLPRIDKPHEVLYSKGSEVDLVMQRIRAIWLDELGRELPQLGRDQRIGVLRTILGSVDVRSTVSTASRSYLRFLGGFLARLGVTVKMVKGGPCQPRLDELSLPELGEPLLSMGDDNLRRAFQEKARAMIRAGQPAQVVEVCRKLLDKADDADLAANLITLAAEAERALGAG